MFTQCTHCSTWFAITAEHLRQGHGEVLCGSCTRSFDALLNLRDALPGDLPGEAALERRLPSDGLGPETEDWVATLDVLPEPGDDGVAPTSDADALKDSPREREPLPDDGDSADGLGAPVARDEAMDSSHGDESIHYDSPLERFFASDSMDLDEAFEVTEANPGPSTSDQGTQAPTILTGESAEPRTSSAESARDPASTPVLAPADASTGDGRKAGDGADQPELPADEATSPPLGDIGRLNGGDDDPTALRVEPSLEGLEATSETPPGPQEAEALENDVALTHPDESSGLSDATPSIAGGTTGGITGPTSADDEGATTPNPTSAETVASVPPQVLPHVLQADYVRLERAERARRRRWAYVAGALLCVAALIAQYAWFLPGDLASRYPMTRAWLERFCAETGCELPLSREPRLVFLIQRDVRVHPKYEGALIVSAALVNKAVFSQPFPTILFTLYNVNGQTIASRRFAPAEYLDAAAIDGSAIMLPHEPVQVIFELLAPEEAAVSFEFKFI